MNNRVSEQAAELSGRQKKRRRYLGILAGLAVLVTTVTVIAVKYTGNAMTAGNRILDCQLQVHQHDAPCYNEKGELICGQADYVVHTHEASCYDAEGQLVCTLPEIKAHTHTPLCFVDQKVLICEEAESDGHTHSDACYEVSQGALICGLAEHTHGEACFDENGTLICGLEEHVHGSDCYEWNRTLICGLEEGAGAHHHSDACYAVEKVATCGQLELHTHGKDCYDANGSLICDIPVLEEHIHDDTCFRKVKDDDKAEGSIPAEEKAEDSTPAGEAAGDSTSGEGGDIFFMEEESVEEAETPSYIKSFTQTAETEHYIVEASYTEYAELPADAVLTVREIPEDSDEYRKAVEEIGEEPAWLLDISFVSGGREVEPQAGVSVRVIVKDSREVSDYRIWHFTDNAGTENLAGAGVDDAKGAAAEFVMNSFSIVAGVPSASGYSLSASSSTVEVGKTIELTSDVSGSIKSETWTSDNSSIASVESNGKKQATVTGVSAGKATITHSYKKDGNKRRETIEIIVTPALAYDTEFDSAPYYVSGITKLSDLDGKEFAIANLRSGSDTCRYLTNKIKNGNLQADKIAAPDYKLTTTATHWVFVRRSGDDNGTSGTFRIQDANGYYLNMSSDGTTSVSATPQDFTVSLINGMVTISAKGCYLNNWNSGSSGYFSGWTSANADSYMTLYEKNAETVKVYVYAAGRDSEGNSWFDNEEFLDLIQLKVKDGNNYFPVGEIMLNVSYFEGKSISSYNSSPLINSSGDWDKLLAALGEINTANLISGGTYGNGTNAAGQTAGFAENNANTVNEYLDQATKDLNKGAGSQRSALFRWQTWSNLSTNAGTKSYGFNDQTVQFHLDLNFMTRKITFITGDNGITYGSAKDGTVVDRRVYIKGSEIQAPRNLEIPAGYKLVGYYSDPEMTEVWNGIGTPLNEDEVVYIKITPEENVVIHYAVASGSETGSVTTQAEGLNPVTGEAEGSTAVPADGYSFDGWYADEDCKVKLSAELTFVPEKSSDERWVDGTTYYASFSRNAKTEPLNFYVNLSSQILNYDGSDVAHSSDLFTRSVYASEVVLPADYQHPVGSQGAVINHERDEIIGNNEKEVITSSSSTSAYEVDAVIRTIGQSAGGYSDGTYTYIMADEFPSDEAVMATIRSNWSYYTKDKGMSVNGQPINDPSLLTTEHFRIRWYVFKDNEGDYWHVDGVLVPLTGSLTVTKTFENETAAIAALNAGFSLKVSGSFLGIASERSLPLSGTQAVINDDGTVTYTWSLEVTDGTYTVTEQNTDALAGFRFLEAAYSKSERINGSWSTATGSGTSVSLNCVTNPSDDPNFNGLQRVDLTNRYQSRIKILKVSDQSLDNVVAGAVFTLTDGVNTTTLTSDADGVLYCGAIADGSYQLTEVAAPGGYLKLTTPVTLTVRNGSISALIVGAKTGVTIDTEADGSWALDDDGNVVIRITNTRGTAMPATGGSGTLPFTAAGILLAAAGLILLVYIRRRRSI